MSAVPPAPPPPPPADGRRVARRRLLNRLNGSTALGLLLARAGGARERRDGPDGLLLRGRWRWPVPTGAAFTVGDVVVVRRWELAERPALLRHEEAHARQWAALGPAFLPVYLGAVAWSWWRTGDVWSRNAFERAAGLAAGGYREAPVRRRWPLRRGAVRH